MSAIKGLIKHVLGYACAVVRTQRLVPRIPEEADLLDCINKPLMSWMNYHQQNVLGKRNHFLGVRALKNPMDAWVYLEIIQETKPDIILEIGQKAGGSTLYMASFLDALGHGEIIALDLDRSQYEAKHKRITEVTGDCASPEISDKVHKLCEGKSVMIIHDADHSRRAVARDLALYEDLVRKGHYIIVEDTHEGLPGFCEDPDNPYWGYCHKNEDNARWGAYDFLDRNGRFAIDKSREKWVLTSCYDGYLKCVRDKEDGEAHSERVTEPEGDAS
ncbi:CmcI family methyltransferase [Elusimicrobiota bacterium]